MKKTAGNRFGDNMMMRIMRQETASRTGDTPRAGATIVFRLREFA
jgi:hypothetical protein